MSGLGSASGQPNAPYFDAVVAHGLRGSTRFHVPGHKGGEGADPGLRAAIGDAALKLDVPQDLEGIDLGEHPTPYQRAETLAAEAYGAKRTLFLTNGATQGNHALCLALAALGARVVVQRNSHASVVDGLVLSGGVPSFVAPEYEEGLGMAHGVTRESLGAALDADPDARVAFVVSPTYYGMAADVEGLIAAAHERDVALVVDQSWGPHFGFHPALPPSAVRLGADAVLTSTHKIVGSLTQSAMLHIGDTERIEVAAVERAVRVVRSTSPSALLMASLDAGRRQVAVHGEAMLERTIAVAARVAGAIDAVPGCRVVVGTDVVGTPGVAAWDPLRLVVDVRGTGVSGYEIAAALRELFDVHLELATHATLVLVLGIDQPKRPLERFAHDLGQVVRRIARPGVAPTIQRSPAALVNEVVLPPREAFLGRNEVCAVDDAVGRVSSETIAGYPPGIPALLPGERITGEVIAYLRELTAAGARLHGASDPSFATIRVLA